MTAYDDKKRDGILSSAPSLGMTDMKNDSFLNLYRHGFIRTALCIPSVRIADPEFNARTTIECAKEAAQKGALFAVFPELGLSAYSGDDLFHQDALLTAVREAIVTVVEQTKPLDMLCVIGAPLVVDTRLFNCGIALHHGRILGVAVKSHLPNYREFYEMRQFRPATDAVSTEISLAGHDGVPFGANLIFSVDKIPNFRFFIEICEDVWSPIPPSSYAALAGATVIANISASNITVGKADYRHNLISNQSARTISAYLYTGAGFGESTNDLAWDGHGIIYENGTLLAESERFSLKPQVITADIDLDRLAQDRMRMTVFSDTAGQHNKRGEFRTIPVAADPPAAPFLLERDIPRFPYVPSGTEDRHRRCYEIFNIQVNSLIQRLSAADIENIVIGVSGGLDSAHALIVAARAMDRMGRDRSHIFAYSMPGFATSRKTRDNAVRLMTALGVECNETDIRESCMQMFRDIGHPYARGENTFDITFENVQAGERTSHLFRIANLRNAMVLGTGDLSELALGWCTYGVGDHMSHYNINGSVPKTLIQYLIRWTVSSSQFDSATTDVLTDVLDTEISPELVPGGTDDAPSQKSEETVGPYELQDFNTYYVTRYGYLPTKIAFMAYCAWHDTASGAWPDVPESKRRAYTLGEIKHWLTVFIHRFFHTSQFKRTCVPNGPKVGSGGSLSPRGDYRAPSDGSAAPWLQNVQKIPGEVE